MDATAPGGLRPWLRALPKTDLHVHAMGAIRPTTMLELAGMRGAAVLPDLYRAMEEGYAFEDLPAFVRFVIGLFEIVREPEDFERVTFEVLEDAADQGVRYVELRWTPTSHLARGASEEGMFGGIEAGRRAVQRVHGIHARLVVDFPRGLPLEVAEQATGIAIRQRGRGVVALDVAGDEARVAADPRFAAVFADARRAGLATTAHAGEAAGPESVAGALDLYGARRIGHGTRAIEDPGLVGRLAREGVVLEVCPTSNLRLGVVPSLAAHPVRAFLAAGVRCTVGTDDPTLFGTDLISEYERLHGEVGLDREALVGLAATGFEAALVEEGPSGEETRAHLASWRAALRA